MPILYHFCYWKMFKWQKIMKKNGTNSLNKDWPPHTSLAWRVGLLFCISAYYHMGCIEIVFGLLSGCIIYIGCFIYHPCLPSSEGCLYLPK